MSNDAIELGSKWRWKQADGCEEVFTVEGVARSGLCLYFLRFDDGHLDSCGLPWFQRHIADGTLTRIDTPAAVKVGDVVKDPALLQVGMLVEWAPKTWAERVGPWTVHSLEAIRGNGAVQSDGVRILALPEPAKAEICTHPSAGTDGCISVCDSCGHEWRVPGPAKAYTPWREFEVVSDEITAWVDGEKAPPPASPRCKPGCSPQKPCFTVGVCSAFKENSIAYEMGEWHDQQRGISADLPAARASTYVTRYEGLAGWATRGRR